MQSGGVAICVYSVLRALNWVSESGARFRLGVTARTSGQSVASSDESLLTFGAETNVLTFLCCKLSTLMSNVVQD